MPSGLDRRLTSIVARITASGTPFAIGTNDRRGVNLLYFKKAPPTLPALFDAFCARHDQVEFLVDGVVRLSFAETHALAQRVAAGLATRHGIRPGDRVAIAARNSASWIIAYMGVLMAGGCVTLLGASWSGEELAGGLALADCTLVLADRPRAHRLAEAPMAARLVLFDHGEPEQGLAPLLGHGDGAWPMPALTGDDFAAILFTSGATGMVKAAVSDHHALVQAAFNAAVHDLAALITQTHEGELPRPQSTLVGMPLSQVGGEIILLLQSFVTGRRLIVMPRWDAREAMHLIERERITFFAGTPLMGDEIASHPSRVHYDLSSCTGIGISDGDCPADLVDRLGKMMPQAALSTGYGLTETNAAGCSNFAENCLAKPLSVGRASTPLVEIAVLGPDGTPLPAGLRGAIAVRSICNFRGYWNNPEETAAVLREDGFFLTGDLGYCDEDDHLFVIARQQGAIVGEAGNDILPQLGVEKIGGYRSKARYSQAWEAAKGAS